MGFLGLHPGRRKHGALKKDLRDNFVKLVLPKMEQAVIKALEKSKFSTLVLKEGMHSFAYFLMNPKSLPWPEPIRQAMIGIAKGAKSVSFRYKQVNDLLRFFLEIVNDRMTSFNIDQVKTILKDQEFTNGDRRQGPGKVHPLSNVENRVQIECIYEIIVTTII